MVPADDAQPMTVGSDRPTPDFSEGQMITVFRSRRHPRAETAYRSLSHEMEVAARAAAGFVDFKTFTAEDGEHVSLVTFATRAEHQAWRDDLRHRHAQDRGRQEFYLEYSIQVGECSHVSRWTAPPT
jgi:heme-degrading monooxygenase HmoA